jgi:fucose permease
MAKGGEFYPHRIASLAGALSAAGISGGVIYPPLMGFVADSIGLRTGMIGAAVLGIPLAACVLVAEFSYRRAVSQV